MIIGVLLACTISRPVRQVTEANHQLSSDQLGFQVPVNSGGKLGELAVSFNRMSADLEHTNRRRRQMTADIAHDLRTPLSVIMEYMESLSLGKMQPTSQTLGVMYAKTRHLQYLINDLHISSSVLDALEQAPKHAY